MTATSVSYHRRLLAVALGAVLAISSNAKSNTDFFKKIVGGSATTSVKVDKRLTEDTMSVNLKNMQYAVRGQVVIAADKITQNIKESNDGGTSNEYPFDHIIYTNIGNPHSVGQKALTWPRQVLALCDLPDEMGIDHPKAKLLFPADAIDRAREIKKRIGWSWHRSLQSFARSEFLP